MFNQIQGLFEKQPDMRKFLYSLLPVTLGAVYFFGWRTIVLMAVVACFGIGTEYLFKRRLNRPVTEAVIVTSVLFTLTLPVSTPFWVAAVGIIFGVAFAQEVFGGYGYHVFNPALAARTFLYVTFPEPLTVRWNVAASGFPGGFAHYITPAIDTITQSTPLIIFRQTRNILPLDQLFWGNASGSLGETSAFFILIGAAYLLYTKVADWKLMVSPIIGFVGVHTLLTLLNVGAAPSLLVALFSGGFLFASVFMITDSATAPKTTEGKIIYGTLIGGITALIRIMGIFVGGAMFAVLIMNTFAPILDEGVKYVQSARKKVTA